MGSQESISFFPLTVYREKGNDQGGKATPNDAKSGHGLSPDFRAFARHKDPSAALIFQPGLS
jgi:hypothetical protein